MRMVAATVSPGNNFETTVKKSENITKSDFKDELKQKLESNKQDAPKKIEKQNQNKDLKESKSLRADEGIVEGDDQKNTVVNTTHTDKNKQIKNFKALQLESDSMGKNSKKTDKKRSVEENSIKSKKSTQEAENVQASQLLQLQSQSDDIKLINKELTSSDSDNREVKLVKDIKVKTPEQNESKQVNTQAVLGQNVMKKSKNLNFADKKVTKSDEKKKSDNVVKVKDLRTTPVERKAVKEGDNQEIAQNQGVTDLNLEVDESTENSSERTIVLGTTEISAEGDGGKSQAPVMKEATSILKQQLKDFGNSEIVKQSRFILKDNNVGEIRLILKPEALGEVKINLNLNENSLAGQIVVENSSVREVFQENLSSLSAALEKEGFDNTDLNLSLSDKGQREEQQEREKSKQYFSERLKRFDDNGQVVRYGLPTAGINLTA